MKASLIADFIAIIDKREREEVFTVYNMLCEERVIHRIQSFGSAFLVNWDLLSK